MQETLTVRREAEERFSDWVASPERTAMGVSRAGTLSLSLLTPSPHDGEIHFCTLKKGISGGARRCNKGVEVSS